MNYYSFDFSEEIPKINKEKSMPDFKNSWISPIGDYYGIDGAKHLRAATYICIFLLDIGPDNLRKGTYFNETFDSKLLSLGWIQIIDTSWLGFSNEPKFVSNYEPTQSQLNIVFNYCEKHGIEYPY